jgi:uncharacterized protein
MSRIQKGFEVRFRVLLQRAHARRLDQGVQMMIQRARRLTQRKGIPPAEAFALLEQQLVAAVEQIHSTEKPTDSSTPPRFYCDAGLGGLARWLRAAGYEAFWKENIGDTELLAEAQKIGAVVLTTDSGLMERRILRDGVWPGFWLPPALGSTWQLGMVLRHFNLTPRSPRCMACGGVLRKGEKEALRERIPPKTYRWRNDFFVCEECGKLFWYGTHWNRIQAEMEKALDTPAGQAPR